MTTSRTIVGAHYGLRDWLAQRITAVILAAYTVFLLVSLLVIPELTYGTWAGLFANTFTKVATLLAMLSLIYHAWVGVRDIYMDYIRSTALRLLLEVATIVALLGYLCWAVIILWRV
jgi:succinate dehydrogenase / fumarate reductase, membrane anchor subunit